MSTNGPLLPTRFGAFPNSICVDPRIQGVQSLIQHNIHRRLCLFELARAEALSVSRLSHLFKSHFGIAPKRYLKLARMQKAKELLETSTLSVKEITAAIGIDDVSHFVRDFEKHYQLTPSRYRLRFGQQDRSPEKTEIRRFANESQERPMD